MILGSHNSLTYNKCESFLCNILRPTWKCLNIDIKSLYYLGVRCFDFRLYYDNGEWKAAHGITKFDINFYKILYWLSELDEQVYIRMIYEGGTELGEHMFKMLCNEWEHTFNKIIFFEGRKKKGWELLYNFKYNPHPYIILYVSSMLETNIIKKILPYRYAKKYNKQNYKNSLTFDKDQIVLFDFVDTL